MNQNWIFHYDEALRDKIQSEHYVETLRDDFYCSDCHQAITDYVQSEHYDQALRGLITMPMIRPNQNAYDLLVIKQKDYTKSNPKIFL